MQINNKHTSSPVKWATVAILRSGPAASWVGSLVVSTDSRQTGNESKMGT